jgi:hypothetical protein
MDDRSEPERRLDALYVAIRDSATVDRQAAFDIAMNELEYRPLHAEARHRLGTSSTISAAASPPYEPRGPSKS